MRVCSKKQKILISFILILFCGLTQLVADEYNPYSRALEKGMFLVASKNLLDPNFAQTVVVLIEYSSQGAVGLIINRKTDVRLSKVLPDNKAFLRKRTDTVYVGGPVGVDQLLIIVRSYNNPDDSYNIMNGLYLYSNLDALEELFKQGDDGLDFRAYAGYAGWAPGQLDSEVARGDWFVVSADIESVFSQVPEEVWPQLIARSTAHWTKSIINMRWGRFKLVEAAVTHE